MLLFLESTELMPACLIAVLCLTFGRSLLVYYVTLNANRCIPDSGCSFYLDISIFMFRNTERPEASALCYYCVLMLNLNVFL